MSHTDFLVRNNFLLVKQCDRTRGLNASGLVPYGLIICLQMIFFWVHQFSNSLFSYHAFFLNAKKKNGKEEEQGWKHFKCRFMKFEIILILN